MNASQSIRTRLFWRVLVFGVVLNGMVGSELVSGFEDRSMNVLLIAIDDLRPELNCFGKTYIHSPNIDQLAGRGRVFQRHYVQAPTCGASRFALLTGRYGPASNQALFQRAQAIVHPSFPAWFRQHGYETVSVGKVSHHPGGWGGADWDDRRILEMPQAWDLQLMPCGPWRHPRGAMHGLANGAIRIQPKTMDVLESFRGDDRAYPDGWITDAAIEQLGRLGRVRGEKPFFLAVGWIKPHLPFGAPARYLQKYAEVRLPAIPHPSRPAERSTWHRSPEFMKYHRWGKDPNADPDFATEVRKHYAACVSYADAQVGRILAELDRLGLRDQTIVVLWGDHGWHLGEHGVWGKHTLFEESLRAPLIIAGPGIQKPGQATRSIVETIDIFPTVCQLAAVPEPSFVDGRSLVDLLNDPTSDGHDAVSYQARATTLRTDAFRLIVHSDFTELYDHRSDPGETDNVAEQNPDVVRRLRRRLDQRLGR